MRIQYVDKCGVIDVVKSLLMQSENNVDATTCAQNEHKLEEQDKSMTYLLAPEEEAVRPQENGRPMRSLA